MFPVEVEPMYDNRVPAAKIGSGGPPTLLPVSKLTNEHDIVLLMGADDPSKDDRQTIDLSPLYRTVSPIILTSALI